MREIIGAQIRVLRKSKHWTIEQLADQVNVSKSTIGMYERGERKPDLETLLKIAYLFNVSLEFFLDKHTPDVVKIEDIFIRNKINERAEGNCELCSRMAPFITSDGQPYLELFSLDEQRESVVALCPNCVKKMHHLNLPGDRFFLKKKLAN